MRNFALLLLLSLSCLALRCASGNKLESANVNQQDIYQSYVVRRAKDGIEAHATFRLKDRYGDTLALNAPSSVTHNDKAMARRDVFMSGAQYFADADSYSSTHRFEFTDGNGKRYVNSMSLEGVEFSGSVVELKKGAQNILPVTRLVKESDSKTTLSINDANNQSVYAEVQGGRGIIGARHSVYFDEAKKAIIIEPDFLKELAAGAATITLTVRKERDKLEQAGGRGGDIAIEYTANPASATISQK